MADAFTRLLLALVKVEGTYGTDAVPVAATDAILCGKDSSVHPVKTNRVERNIVQTYFGTSPKVVVGNYVAYEINCEAVGSGTAGSKPSLALDALLQISLFAPTVNAGVSVVYNPIYASIPSATIYYNKAGRLFKLVGCRNYEMSLTLNAEGLPMFSFKGFGLKGGRVDTALTAGTFTQPAALPVNNAQMSGFALDSYAAIPVGLSFTKTIKGKYRNLPGLEDILVTDATTAGNVEVLEPPIATKDYYSIGESGIIVNGTVLQGATAGKKLQSDWKSQLEDPDQGDKDGVVTMKSGFICPPSTAGADEWVLTFK